MVMNTKNYMIIINDYDNIAILKFDGEHCGNAISFKDNHENIYENLQDMDENEADVYINELYTSFCDLAKIIDINVFC